MMKRILFAIISLLIGISLCACSEGEVNSDGIWIETSSEFFDYTSESFDENEDETSNNKNASDSKTNAGASNMNNTDKTNSQPSTTENKESSNEAVIPSYEEETDKDLPITQTISRENSPLSLEKAYNILFIGNSHTYCNQMPEEIFSSIAKSAGYNNVKVKSISVGGAAFSNHLTQSFGTYSQIKTHILSGEYDYVVLQERLADPITVPITSSYNADSFAKMIKSANPNTKIVLYQVWGGAAGNIKLKETGCSTTHEINMRLAATNTWMAKKIANNNLMTAMVAYSGLTFIELENSVLGSTIYAADGYHPSYIGSYASALTIFSTIFGADPNTVTWNGSNEQISNNNAILIKNAVQKVVFNTQNIDTVYSDHIPNN